jgi:hypothetical protein
MANAFEKLYEGTYEYYRQGQNYSQENFSVEMNEDSRDILFQSEIMSRVETGEFFKMQVRYLLNQFYVPQVMTVEKFLGDKVAREAFEIDVNNQVLKHTFRANEVTKTSERPFSTTKHFLTSPAFVTAGLFSITKKIDSTARTPLNFITPKLGWELQGPPEDKLLWIDVRTHNSEELEINGMPLTSTQYDLHTEDGSTGTHAIAGKIWVSGHYGIPYQLEESDGSRIMIKRLKRLKNKVEKI